MSARVDLDLAATSADATTPQSPIAAPLVAALDPEDRWGGHALPSDHPAWMRDTLSISQRARAMLARIRPIVVKVATCWEHRVRSIVIGDRRLSVDASGSYRLD
jgi:hypothetical protein